MIKVNSPKASFLMTAWNSEAFIAESISAVLAQTEEDFEFIIVDDASTDGTTDVIQNFKDERIIHIKNDRNLYIGASANIGLTKVISPYVLRIDSDDICLPQRLEKQLAFMEANPEIGVCGSFVEFFDQGQGTWKMPTKIEDIKATLLFDNCIANSSVIIRMKVLRETGLRYLENNSFPRTYEDYELWAKLVQFTDFANLPEVLVKKRERQNNETMNNSNTRLLQLENYFAWFFEMYNYPVSMEEIKLHLLDYDEERQIDLKLLKEYRDWHLKLEVHFSKPGLIQRQALKKAAAKKWRNLIKRLPFLLLNDFYVFTDFEKGIALKAIAKRLLKK